MSNDEIQVFKNLRPPVPERLILFNVFKKYVVTRVQDFLMFDKIILKILGIVKSHYNGERIKKSFVISNYMTRQVRKCLLLRSLSNINKLIDGLIGMLLVRRSRLVM